ncbi:class I SAM-dependent methyltransferase [Lacinutrix sp. Bg11-31]|uniref:class I SAM-dependent DNA methyltransferase n=1 Tax=Lacinutrix sp. Bg11-31 TaxID=2057808 RepID=UPI000C3156A1|nr:class I SAM-dependent methyltransferase [Lacinutrix sp. Bg11-31]AUC81323.1 class I SAM-dependent methyltransferase [Lacinutrix sp. Bg11-31]
MQSLYSNGFEAIYDEMHQTFIDYNEEYHFYNNILSKYNKKEVLEIGSGTGNLANHFIKNDFNYLGIDYSQDMVNLAKSKLNKDCFLQGNMCSFNLKKTVESIIITGRTSSYLLSNKDVDSTLKAIHKNLKKDGILCFDFIDANRFFKDIKGGLKIKHSATFNNKKYNRDSFLIPTTSNNFMFNWESKYYETQNKKKQLIAKDNSEVRAFTKNEWEIFLHLSNFKLIEFIDKPAYMFDTYIVVAKKR